MKKLVLCLLLIAQANFAQTAEEKAEAKKKVEQEKAVLAKPYHEEEDASIKVAELLTTAKKENKKILIQVGGNWCIWCLRLNDFINKNETLKQLVDTNYSYYHLNWSPKNKNEKFFSQYGSNPGEKHGYPVFMILNADGKLVHIQETGSLEEGKGYSVDKVKAFLETNISK
ncbi:Disulfide bond reductase DsbH precursor [Flavobacterium columnare]|uniref:Thioredoxin family protein n=2 Tax=Flavobacterium TaxID=237 RepID=A0ABW8PS31_9FLAO|nr:thioredoxin family protein [Flavobacterium columnare]SPE76171.1 Disulfide bond reductase DsbH precursor [Flavobacterium columnare]